MIFGKEPDLLFKCHLSIWGFILFHMKNGRNCLAFSTIMPSATSERPKRKDEDQVQFFKLQLAYSSLGSTTTTTSLPATK